MITIKHKGNFIFEAENEKSKITINPKEYSPIELFITGMAGCTAYDIVDFLKDKLSDFELEVEYDRREEYPRIFTKISLTYHIYSDATDEEVMNFVRSSLKKYCSTTNSLREDIEFKITLIHNGNVLVLNGDKDLNEDDELTQFLMSCGGG
ncbi:OsmC family protein [Caminibacter mediatlanticus]|uniref:OsmC-like protein n=1 Tax=Caminibacter mediatlanticus TB-2 TaxID=391592 RepID=A0AAI9F356_9BACT|nr:OsmC family protein [Caminibacter mediatlanticus]EDM24291.1 OsmC-like protein [Caminibacter mediatlanticus TB-2]